MSFDEVNRVLLIEGLTAPEKICLAVIARDHHPERGAWPSLERLATLTGLSRRSVQDQIARLANKGLITVSKRRNERGHLPTNHYQLHLGQEVPKESDDLGQMVQPPWERPATSLGQEVPTKQIYEPDKGISTIADEIRVISDDNLRLFLAAYPQGRRRIDIPGVKKALSGILSEVDDQARAATLDAIITGARNYADSGQSPEWVCCPVDWLGERFWQRWEAPIWQWPPETFR